VDKTNATQNVDKLIRLDFALSTWKRNSSIPLSGVRITSCFGIGKPGKKHFSFDSIFMETYSLFTFKKRKTKMVSHLADGHLNAVLDTNNNATVGAHSGGRKGVEQNRLGYRSVEFLLGLHTDSGVGRLPERQVRRSESDSSCRCRLVHDHLLDAQYHSHDIVNLESVDSVHRHRSHHQRCISGRSLSEHDQHHQPEFESIGAHEFFLDANVGIGVGHSVDRDFGLVHSRLLWLADRVPGDRFLGIGVDAHLAVLHHVFQSQPGDQHLAAQSVGQLKAGSAHGRCAVVAAV
jgi:hypothetical protein